VRILVLTDLYPPYYLGGAELSCADHVRRLRARGHDVNVLTSRWGVDRPMTQGNVDRILHYDTTGLAEGVAKWSHRGPLRVGRRYDQVRRALSLQRNYRLARARAADFRPDVGYAWHLGRVSIAPLLALQDAGIPIVMRLPDYWLAQLRAEICLEPDRLRRWYRGLVSGMGGFDRLAPRYLFANSWALARSYVEAGYPAKILRVLPEGLSANLLVDDEVLLSRPAPGSGGEVRLFCAGRLVEEKGMDTAIRALACLKGDAGAPRVRLEIAGQGEPEYLGELCTLANHLGVAGRLCFLGALDHASLLETYARQDIYVFPSRWVEPFGRGVIEAMARGTPVIASNRGGPAEIITDGEDGLLVPPNDPAAIAEAVKRLVAQPDLVQRIRRNGLATVRARFCNERLIEQVEECLCAATRPDAGAGAADVPCVESRLPCAY
jgi:glycogen synthase